MGRGAKRQRRTQAHPRVEKRAVGSKTDSPRRPLTAGRRAVRGCVLGEGGDGERVLAGCVFCCLVTAFRGDFAACGGDLAGRRRGACGVNALQRQPRLCFALLCPVLRLSAGPRARTDGGAASAGRWTGLGACGCGARKRCALVARGRVDGAMTMSWNARAVLGLGCVFRAVWLWGILEQERKSRLPEPDTVAGLCLDA